LDLTNDAQYYANLVNVNMWLSTSEVYYMATPYPHNDIFLTDIISYDRLKFC